MKNKLTTPLFGKQTNNDENKSAQRRGKLTGIFSKERRNIYDLFKLIVLHKMEVVNGNNSYYCLLLFTRLWILKLRAVDVDTGGKFDNYYETFLQ